MRQRFIELAKTIARKSEHPDYRLGACIIQGNKVISIGINKNKTHTKSNSRYKTIHAEFNAIYGIDADKLKGSDLYVVRLKSDGTIGMAKPCICCQELIKYSGIRRVYYSTEYGIKKL